MRPVAVLLLAAALMAPLRAETTDLSGPWEFRTDPGDRGLREGWSGGGPADGWTEVAVPSNWNTLRPEWRGYEGVAWYRREFTLDSTPPFARLRFHGANDRARVWVNGVEVGSHEGGYTGFSLDIAPALRPGRNLLVVRLDNSRRWDSVPPGWYGFENFGGLYRGVLLETGEAGWDNHSIRVRAAGPDTATLEVSLSGFRHSLGDAVPRLFLDSRELPYQVSVVRSPEPPPPPFSTRVDELRLSAELPADRLRWSPGEPETHTLELRLQSGGRVVSSLNASVGLRRLEVRGSELLLDGEPLNLRGVALHEEHPGLGRVFNETLVRRDFELMKAAGVNFVRLSHYPHHSRVLDIADEMGLLVMEEVPAYWMSAAQMGDPEIRAKAEQQVREMVLRDRHHPSVILWGVGNEVSSHTPEGEEFLCRLAEVVRELDPARPVTFASNRPFDDRAWRCMDVVAFNEYYGWYFGDLSTLERALASATATGKPVLVTEFGADAVPGRHGTGKWTEEFQARFIADHWRILNATPGVVGGTVWVWADFEDPDRPLNPVPYWNLKGLVTADREPKLAYGVVSDLYHGREPRIPLAAPEGPEAARWAVALGALGALAALFRFRRRLGPWPGALMAGGVLGLALPAGVARLMESHPLALLGPRSLLDLMVLLLASPLAVVVGVGLLLLWAGFHRLVSGLLGGLGGSSIAVATVAGVALLPAVAAVAVAPAAVVLAALAGCVLASLGVAARETKSAFHLSWPRALFAALLPGLAVAGLVAGLLLLYFLTHFNPDWLSFAFYR